MKPRRSAPVLTGILLLSTAASAWAKMGNTPSDHGLLPHDVATAQALSIFNTQTSSVYYNPARLAGDERSELTGGIFHAEQELRARSLGGDAPRDRENDILNATPSQQLLLGLKTNLTDLTTFGHPLYLGFMVGSEKYGRELLSFKAQTSEEGQFLRHGRQPLFLALGFGTQLWRGIDIGVATRVTLHSDARLDTRTDLSGNTENEDLEVTAEPVVRPMAGLHIAMGETFCSVQNCWLDRLNIAMAYRGYSNTRVGVDAEAEIPGTVSNPGLPMVIDAIDSFQPEIGTLGIEYSVTEHTRVGLTGEYQAWRRLNDDLERDTVRDQASVRFEDTIIPRLGLAHDLTPDLTVKTGVAREPSPLVAQDMPDVNYLDTDRWIAGLGFSYVAHGVPFMKHPVRIDFGYQYQDLRAREFELTSTDNADPQPYETVEASGDVHVFTGSLTLQF